MKTIKSQNPGDTEIPVLASNPEHGVLVDNRDGAFSTNYQEYPDELLGLNVSVQPPKILDVYTDEARRRAHFPD